MAGLLALGMTVHAQSTNTPTITRWEALHNTTVTEGILKDLWSTRTYTATNYVLKWGKEVQIVVELWPGQGQVVRTSDPWWANLEESFHLNVNGSFLENSPPSVGYRTIDVEWWLSDVNPEHPKTGQGKPPFPDSYENRMTSSVTVDSSGDFRLAVSKELTADPFSFRDIHAILKNKFQTQTSTESPDYIIEDFQFQFDRYSILPVPEPSSTGVAMGLAALGFAWVQHRRRSARARPSIEGGPRVS